MEATLSKWGNSLAFRIPSVLVKELDLRENLKLKFYLDGDSLILKKEKPKLENLLEKVSEENLHKEIETGEILGKEIF